MGTITLFYLLFLVLAAAIVAVVMWQVGSFLKIPSATYPSSFKACFLIGLGVFAATWVRTIGESAMPGAPVYSNFGVAVGPSYAFIAVQVLLIFLIALVVTKLFLFASFSDSAIVTVVVLLSGWLIVFLLNFGVRAVLVESVVVSQGAMSPLVVGSHHDLQCENCALPYQAGAPNPLLTSNKQLASSYSAACPNCGQFNAVASGAKVAPGDCLAISKMGKPSRFDVVQVKHNEATPPQIGRVIGLPGETVEFIGGDAFIDGKRLQKAPGEAEDLWVLVHDSNFKPAKAVKDGWGWKLPNARSKWKFESQWQCDNNRADSEPLPFLGVITERITYNMRQDGKPADVFVCKPVGDIKLEFDIDELVGEGAFGVEYAFANRTISVNVTGQGNVELSANELSLDGDTVRLGSKNGKLTSTLSLSGQLTLGIRDGLAYVSERGVPVASLQVAPKDVEAAKTAEETKSRLPPEMANVFKLSLQVRAMSIKFTRIRVYRDIYYRGPEDMPASLFEGINKRPAGKVKIGPDAYFVVGDNPWRAKDSRVYGPVEPAGMMGVVKTRIYPLGRYRAF